MKSIIGLLTGLLFGLGLTVSQMVDPQKVKNFLDVFGNWDPSLAFVMGGALLVFGSGYFLVIRRKEKAILGDVMPKKSQAPVDKKLLIGAGLFGIGWGLSGICPGPAIANVSGFDSSMLMFIVVMIIGLQMGNKIKVKY